MYQADAAERPSRQCCQTVFMQERGKIAHVLLFLLKVLLAHASAAAGAVEKLSFVDLKLIYKSIALHPGAGIRGSPSGEGFNVNRSGWGFERWWEAVPRRAVHMAALHNPGAYLVIPRALASMSLGVSRKQFEH
jgi:hypothetical protein